MEKTTIQNDIEDVLRDAQDAIDDVREHVTLDEERDSCDAREATLERVKPLIMAAPDLVGYLVAVVSSDEVLRAIHEHLGDEFAETLNCEAGRLEALAGYNGSKWYIVKAIESVTCEYAVRADNPDDAKRRIEDGGEFHFLSESAVEDREIYEVYEAPAAFVLPDDDGGAK